MNKTTPPFKKISIAVCLIAIVTLLFSTGVYSQSKEIQKSDPVFVQSNPLFTKTVVHRLSSQSSERITTLTNSRKTKQVDIVRLPYQIWKTEELTFFVDQKTGQLTFDNTGTGLVVRKKSLEILSEDEIAWTGIIYVSTTREEAGDITLILHKERGFTGSIDLEGNFYEIQPLGASGLHTVRSVDTEYQRELYKGNDVLVKKTSQRKQFVPEGTSYTQPIIAEQSGTRCSPEYQRLLVLFTANAAQGRDINGIISLAIQEANEAYTNSQVTNLKIALAHSQQINFTESNDIERDLLDLRNDVQVQNLRNQHNADAVLLLTDGNYGSAGGIASEILATTNSAHAIVQAEFSGGADYVFAHELGHLQGAQHHPDDPVDVNGPFSYGFGHRFSYKASIFVPRRYRSTIMAYPCRPQSQDFFCDRVYYGRKHFSNPNVEYRGSDTGIQGQRENWLVLKNTAATIADLRDANELQASVRITSSNSVTGQFSFASDICGGQTSPTYQWQVSYDDPFTYGPVVGTGSTFSRTFPPGNHYIRLTARAAGGVQVSEAFKSIIVDDDDCQQDEPCEFLSGSLAKMNQSAEEPERPAKRFALHAAYPNPFNPSTNITFTLPEEQSVRLAVYNLSGREVAVLTNSRLPKGAHTYTFDASDLSGGMYFVRLQSGSMVESRKITLIK